MLDTCMSCRHFRDDPAHLESACAGLASLGSAFAAVRGKDGLCEHHDRFVSADARCKDFQPRFLATAPIENHAR